MHSQIPQDQFSLQSFFGSLSFSFFAPTPTEEKQEELFEV